MKASGKQTQTGEKLTAQQNTKEKLSSLKHQPLSSETRYTDHVWIPRSHLPLPPPLSLSLYKRKGIRSAEQSPSH